MPPAPGSTPTTERVHLDETCWVDVIRGWVQDGDQLYDSVRETAKWSTSRVFRYDHWVEEPRLGSFWRVGDPPPHPVLLEAHRGLQHRYAVRFDGFALAWYRDGSDSVAFHRDRDMRWLDDTLIAILTLGATRPFLLRPRSGRYDHGEGRGVSHDLAPGSGDLLVMGGACQQRWEHSVPKVDSRIGGRISVQWRWTSRRGPMEKGGSYRSPRRYGER